MGPSPNLTNDDVILCYPSRRLMDNLTHRHCQTCPYATEALQSQMKIHRIVACEISRLLGGTLRGPYICLRMFQVIFHCVPWYITIFPPPFGRRFFGVTWIPSASYEANLHPPRSTWIFTLSEAVNGSVWWRLHLDHDMAMQCCAAGRVCQSHLFGEKSGYTVGKESLYCRDLRFLTSGHPRFLSVLFRILLGWFMVLKMFLKWKIPGKSTLLSFLSSSCTSAQVFGTCINGPHHRSRMT